MKEFLYSGEFYVCSYGGCASWTIHRFLKNYGTVYHIHSRFPPKYLTLPVSRKWSHRFSNEGVREHFSDNPADRIEVTTAVHVIFLYIKPVYSIYSRRAFSQRHLKSIGVTKKNLNILKTLSRQEYMKKNEDLINYEEFFNNYVNETAERNYDIISVNVEKLWDNLDTFFEYVDIPKSDKDRFPERRKPQAIGKITKYMDNIYSSYNTRIDEMDPIVTIPMKQSERRP